MRLHYAPGSPHSAAVRIALAEKGIEAELHKLDLARHEQHSRQYLAVSRHGMVPVIEDDRHTLYESFFILEYLDELQPDPPLGGNDPRQRYLARKWGKYVETHIAPHLAIARWAALQGKVSDGAVPALANLLPARCELWLRAKRGFDHEQLSVSTRALLTAADRLAADLADGEWVAGDRFTLGDIAVYPHLVQFSALGLAVPKAVEQWLGRVAERSSVHAIRADLFPLAVMGPEPGRWG